jgi:hypothetical protein
MRFLATRNGRFLDGNLKEFADGASEAGWARDGIQVTYDTDIDYDFGGHIWAGRISWLKDVWHNFTQSFDDAEDFWLSAVLKSKFNIGTRKPKCLKPNDSDTKRSPDFCACSHKSATHHENAVAGGNEVSISNRHAAMINIGRKFQYEPLLKNDQKIVEKSNLAHKIHEHPIFDLNGTIFSQCLYWV